MSELEKRQEKFIEHAAMEYAIRWPESYDHDIPFRRGFNTFRESPEYLVMKSELAKYKEALSDKLTEDQGYCQEYTGIVILKEKLADAEIREAKLVAGLKEAATRMEILTARMRGCHEETGKHELLCEADMFCKGARSVLKEVFGGE